MRTSAPEVITNQNNVVFLVQTNIYLSFQAVAYLVDDNDDDISPTNPGPVNPSIYQVTFLAVVLLLCRV